MLNSIMLMAVCILFRLLSSEKIIAEIREASRANGRIPVLSLPGAKWICEKSDEVLYVRQVFYAE